MRGAILVLLSLPIALAVAGTPAAATEAACNAPDRSDLAFPTPAATYYVDTYSAGGTDYVDLWREANGLSGLQRVAFTCSDGTVVAPDVREATQGASPLADCDVDPRDPTHPRCEL